MKKRRFVLLDRDGTIIVEKNYLSNPDHVKLIPSALEALRKFKKLQLGLLIITNQSGVGRGYFSLRDLKLIHERMTDLLASEEIVLDGIYFCPHKPEDNCSCRKPKLGLVEEAAKKHSFDPKLSFVIGDKAIDIEMGKRLGATTFLVRTGYGKQAEKERINPDHVVDDLEAALPLIKNIISFT